MLNLRNTSKIITVWKYNKRMKRLCHARTNQKKAGVAVSISDFKAKSITRDKEEYIRMISN